MPLILDVIRLSPYGLSRVPRLIATRVSIRRKGVVYAE